MTGEGFPSLPAPRISPPPSPPPPPPSSSFYSTWPALPWPKTRTTGVLDRFGSRDCSRKFVGAWSCPQCRVFALASCMPRAETRWIPWVPNEDHSALLLASWVFTYRSTHAAKGLARSSRSSHHGEAAPRSPATGERPQYPHTLPDNRPLHPPHPCTGKRLPWRGTRGKATGAAGLMRRGAGVVIELGAGRRASAAMEAGLRRPSLRESRPASGPWSSRPSAPLRTSSCSVSSRPPVSLSLVLGSWPQQTGSL